MNRDQAAIFKLNFSHFQMQRIHPPNILFTNQATAIIIIISAYQQLTFSYIGNYIPVTIWSSVTVYSFAYLNC